MLDMIERQTRLTVNQWKIVVAAILGDMLDFFDFYLIGYVLAFIVGPWKLTFGKRSSDAGDRAANKPVLPARGTGIKSAPEGLAPHASSA